LTADATAPVAVVAVTNLIKQFGRFAALRGVTAEFSGGKLYAILGDNGAGKTTLLRTLAGLNQPSSGEVAILGSSKFHDICQHVGYMAHPSLLYDEMSGMENLQYFARLYGIISRTRCAEVIRAVGLDPELVRPVGQYSQGMRQRMSLARALLNDPKVLLLDEPFSNVDLHSATEMVRLLAGIRDRGTTIFIVTHQASLLEGAADEFVWMEFGKIVGRTRELKRPETSGESCGAISEQIGGEYKMSTPTGITRVTLLKDLRLEWRSKDAINSMLFFSLLVVVVFSFSFDPSAEESRQIAGGLVWVAFLFAAVVALNQTWAREIRNQVLDAYRVSPAPANSLFIAKTLGNFIFVSVLETLMTPLFIVFYRLRALGPVWQLLLVGVFGTWALVVNGTFFAAMSLRTRSREIMLPLLLFPISIPALLAMVQATTSILNGEGARFWIVLLATYDLVFTTVCLLLFETVLNAE
jgi:heme exporter protein B